MLLSHKNPPNKINRDSNQIVFVCFFRTIIESDSFLNVSRSGKLCGYIFEIWLFKHFKLNDGDNIHHWPRETEPFHLIIGEHQTILQELPPPTFRGGDKNDVRFGGNTGILVLPVNMIPVNSLCCFFIDLRQSKRKLLSPIFLTITIIQSGHQWIGVQFPHMLK